jgi:hypothetical protein
MKYQIQYNYYSGDSLGSTDSTGILELEWKDLQVAKDNLKRIQEHWKYYDAKEEIQGAYHKRKETKEYINKIEQEQPDWYVKPDKDNKYFVHHCIILYTDDGKPWQFWCPWCGYFEGLYGAEIINVQSDLKFSI